MEKQKRNTIKTTLLTIGLNEKEIQIYETLLEIGTAPASEIAKATNLKRGTTYNILESLQKKGLLTTFQKDLKTYFQVEPPQKLSLLAKEKENEFKIAQQNLENILPNLQSQYQLSIGKPTIQYYEGQNGIKEVFKDIFATKNSTVYGIANLDKVEKAFPSYILKDIIPNRKENNIKAVSIFNESELTTELAKNDNIQNRETTLINQDKYPFPAEIDVYEDKTALLTFEDGNFIGLIIQNKSIAESLKSAFKLVRDMKKELKK